SSARGSSPKSRSGRRSPRRPISSRKNSPSAQGIPPLPLKARSVSWHFRAEDTVMDHEQLVRRATGGDMQAFVALTRQFQHVAFGSALALVRDFQKAEDVVQEAFLAAWSALPSLAEPKPFPGGPGGIFRHHAFGVLRRKDLQDLPLADADNVAVEEPAADHRLEHRQRAAAVMAAMAELPDELREPAMLFFV